MGRTERGGGSLTTRYASSASSPCKKSTWEARGEGRARCEIGRKWVGSLERARHLVLAVIPDFEESAQHSAPRLRQLLVESGVFEDWAEQSFHLISTHVHVSTRYGVVTPTSIDPWAGLLQSNADLPFHDHPPSDPPDSLR
eukprot:1195568-Prorocentrum_minimum.AAC.2